MTTLTLSARRFDRVGTLFDEPVVERKPVVERIPRPRSGPAPEHTAQPSGGPTLDDVIAAGWERLTAGATVACPVCHGELRPVWSTGPRPMGGRCQDCGSRLS